MDRAALISTTTRTTWRNWAGTVEHRDFPFALPESVDAVVTLVQRGLREGLPLRVVGGGHAWSDLTRHPRGVLVSLDRLAGLRGVDVERRQLTVHAGMWPRDLHELLDARGLALSSLGSIPHQSIAGVTATSTRAS